MMLRNLLRQTISRSAMFMALELTSLIQQQVLLSRAQAADLFSVLRATTGIRSSGAMVAVKVRHTTFSMMQLQSLSQDLRRLLSGQTLTFQMQRVSTLRSLSVSGGAETSTSLRSFFSTRTAKRSRALT